MLLNPVTTLNRINITRIHCEMAPREVVMASQDSSLTTTLKTELHPNSKIPLRHNPNIASIMNSLRFSTHRYRCCRPVRTLLFLFYRLHSITHACPSVHPSPPPILYPYRSSPFLPITIPLAHSHIHPHPRCPRH